MKRRAAAAVVMAAALVVAALAVRGAWRAGAGEDAAVAGSGVVETVEADLSFLAAGRVAEIGVVEGDRVEAGALLARLDAAELEARRDVADAQLAVAAALLAELERGSRPEEVAQAAAAAEAAARRLDEAARVLERTRTLHGEDAVSREALDAAETAHQIAVAQLAQAREHAALVRQGPRRERVDGQRAAVRQAAAQLAQAEAVLAHAVIVAPFPGVITVRHRHPGEAVAAGAPVLTLADPDDRWVRIYGAGDEIGRVVLGQRATIYGDDDPARAYEGRVTFIASQAEFTPRNVQTPRERVKLVYAVKVAILGDPGHVLKPGVPADVVLDGGAP
jgi:HlyD family secretion protein